MSPLLLHWQRVRRQWLLVLVIGIVASAGTWAASRQQGTTYTGRAVLTIVSPTRAPEQDTVLAQGYVDYFNQPSSQDKLRRSTGVPAAVALDARVAATSPIIYVDAVADTAALAQTAATALATALRDDVNAGLQRDGQAAVQQLEKQLYAARVRNDSDQVGQIQAAIVQLQSGTNQLQGLQLVAGVSANRPATARNAGAALVGGLLVGALLAVARGRFDRRVSTADEVSDRLGVPVLATVDTGRRGAHRGHDHLLRALIGLTNPQEVPIPGSVAVAGPSGSRVSASRIAEGLAYLRALQGQSSLLLQTDLEAEPSPSGLSSLPGVAQFLAEPGEVPVDGMVYVVDRGLLVAPPGVPRDDAFALFVPPRLRSLVRQSEALADLVVIDAPPLPSVAAQAVCTAADGTVLVLESRRTRIRDAAEALDALRRTGCTVLGVVLVRTPKHLAEHSFLSTGSWTPVGSVPSDRPARLAGAELDGPRRAPEGDLGGPAAAAARAREAPERAAAEA